MKDTNLKIHPFGCGIASPELNLTNKIVNGEDAVRSVMAWHFLLVEEMYESQICTKDKDACSVIIIW